MPRVMHPGYCPCPAVGGGQQDADNRHRQAVDGRAHRRHGGDQDIGRCQRQYQERRGYHERHGRHRRAGPAAEVIERFRVDRDQEYREFGGQCRDFLAEIAKETDAHNLTFAALEENEHDLQKLHTWLGKIRARDFFGASQAQAAADALATCERALHSFAEAIYAREGLQGHAEDERGN